MCEWINERMRGDGCLIFHDCKMKEEQEKIVVIELQMVERYFILQPLVDQAATAKCTF